MASAFHATRQPWPRSIARTDSQDPFFWPESARTPYVGTTAILPPVSSALLPASGEVAPDKWTVAEGSRSVRAGRKAKANRATVASKAGFGGRKASCASNGGLDPHTCQPRGPASDRQGILDRGPGFA